MLSALRRNNSLTFYRPIDMRQTTFSSDYAGGLEAMALTDNLFNTVKQTSNFNAQLTHYLEYIDKTQTYIYQRTDEYMHKQLQKNPDAKTSVLRDKNTFSNYVKPFVTRQELMKLQMGAKVHLPLPKSEIDRIKDAIAGRDLTNISDEDINKIIDDIISPDDRKYMAALKNFKNYGKNSRLLKQSTLNDLKIALDGVDLDKITNSQYQSLKKKYCERHEYHHRESISSDPTKQSNADNIEIDNSTQHDKKHTVTDADGNKKVKYAEPTKERLLNRKGDLEKANHKRIGRNELSGLKMAIATGIGIGFTIGFAVKLAQSGISPSSFACAFVNGAKAGAESGALSTVSYCIGRTIGNTAVDAVEGILTNAGLKMTENYFKMTTMGVVGAITISVFSVYQFMKLKIKGIGTKESLIQVGKQAMFSLSLLAVSIIVQGLWGGAAGIIASTSAGIVVITYSVTDTAHQRRKSAFIRAYIIERSKPNFSFT